MPEELLVPLKGKELIKYLNKKYLVLSVFLMPEKNCIWGSVAYKIPKISILGEGCILSWGRRGSRAGECPDPSAEPAPCPVEAPKLVPLHPPPAVGAGLRGTRGGAHQPGVHLHLLSLTGWKADWSRSRG